MGFGKRKRNAEPRSRDDPKRSKGEEVEGDTRKDNGIWCADNMCNPKFDAFYKAQGILTDAIDWDRFLESLKAPLPACFRLNPNYAFKGKLQQELFEFSQSIAAIAPAAASTEGDGSVARPAVEQIDWFQGGNAYKLGADRRAIRKMEGLGGLHKWMIDNTENGNITRQEAVSMVPPLALDVKPHHRCLDLCAAPGSKTTQILEVIAGGAVQRDEATDGSQKGLVVANDSDTDRAYMLVHQCRRMASASLVITTHKGQEFPSIRPLGPDGVDKKGCFFDRVLCDVPCSGDGTLRKSPHIWPKWSTGNGVDLHQLQLMIAKRGFELLKPGGLMVYSTCSMSPYEDEAVVAELLRLYPNLELVDGREYLPRFRCRPGMSTWNVLDDAKVVWKAADGPSVLKPVAAAASASDAPEGMDVETVEEKPAAAPFDTTGLSDELKACIDIGFRYFRTPEDVPETRHNDNKLRKRFRRSIFPPTAEEASSMHLERCLRCVPQDEDTGGFFVATLRKKEKAVTETVPKVDEPVASAEQAADTAVAPSDAAMDTVAKKRTKYQRGNNEFQVWDSEAFDKVKEFYGLSGISNEAFYIRDDFSNKKGNGANSKSIYYFPLPLREFMAGDLDERVKCVSAGVKTLERKQKVARGECEYRIMQDGVDVLARHMTASDRVVSVSVQEFCNLLGGGLVSFQTLSAQTISALSKLSPGSLICEYQFKAADCIDNGTVKSAFLEKDYTFRVACFRGPSRTINVMCAKVDMDSLKHQLEALNVYRPKISAPKMGDAPVAVEAVEAAAAVVSEEAPSSTVA